ncbi:Holliday junction branch migration protein RuvA [Candidatus Saccharibacteria bacterium SW_7_54_9]|nr:MAG: Holliday junction branch migration protein RuvA [Candidatus Saccharibacteria bacterium SW_7_54_9]
MMITLSGRVTHKLEDSLVVETSGIGYQIWTTEQDLGNAHVDRNVHFWLCESIREDAHELYGFTQWEGRKLFEQLLTVSGIGPKAALAILSIAGVEQAQQAINSGDVAFLQTANGVGKRTAERVAVELKDKLAPAYPAGDMERTQAADDALAALESLGYSRSDATRALAGVDADMDEQSRIKQALQNLS